MNKQNKNDEDLLRTFLNPERIEKAPEGFTSKTLTRIQIESQTEKLRNGYFAKNRVPIISALITAGLIIAAIVIPASETDSVGSTIWKFFLDLEFSLPRINNTYFEKMNLPVWIIYAFMALLLLAFFDKALFGVFHKEKKN
jgi:hypothetical protein